MEINVERPQFKYVAIREHLLSGWGGGGIATRARRGRAMVCV